MALLALVSAQAQMEKGFRPAGAPIVQHHASSTVLEINQGHVHLLSIKKAFLVAGSPAAQLCTQEVVAKSGLETGTDLSKASGVSGAILSSSFSSIVSLTE